MKLQSYRDLDLWKIAVDLVESVYRLVRHFPSQERFGLTNQICRAVVSVPSNIAEGYGRLHRGDYLHHLSISNGSLKEVETQVLISIRLKYVTREQASESWALCERAGQVSSKLMASLGNRPQD